MSRISGKLNLLNLHTVVKMMPAQSGLVECLVIPIDKNRLFKGDKGIYLDIVGFEIDPAKRNANSKDTHILKQSFSKEVREAMTEDELRSLPILGNLQVWDGASSAEPLSSPVVQAENDDLPF
jgi:hypothetical protein